MKTKTQKVAALRRYLRGLVKSDRLDALTLAKKTGLDVERFNSDFSSKSLEEEVLAEYEAGRAEYEGWGIRIAVVGGHYPIAGAVPIAVYCQAIDLCLAR